MGNAIRESGDDKYSKGSAPQLCSAARQCEESRTVEEKTFDRKQLTPLKFPSVRHSSKEHLNRWQGLDQKEVEKEVKKLRDRSAQEVMMGLCGSLLPNVGDGNKEVP